jgi:four helix bundle protein
MGKFRDLKVWQRSKDLAVYIYRETKKGQFSKDFGLRDQIRRAAVSIPSNIAEGDELGSNKQAIRHFYIAKGSSAEVLTQAIISLEIGYIDKNQFEFIEKECTGISGMLMRLIKARS